MVAKIGWSLITMWKFCPSGPYTFNPRHRPRPRRGWLRNLRILGLNLIRGYVILYLHLGVKDSWSFLIPSFNIFAIRQNCMQLCPTVQYFYMIFKSNWKFLWKFEFFEDLNFLNIWIFWKICFLKIWIFHLHKKIKTKFWIS